MTPPAYEFRKMRLFVSLLYHKTLLELQAETKRTCAGFLWWILDPLLSFIVYYTVFKYIFHRTEENFAVFLLVGIVVWRWFHSCVLRSSAILISRRPLMQLVYVHKSLFPLTVCTVGTVKFMFSLILLIAIVCLSGGSLGLGSLLLPILIVLQLSFICACSMFVAAITPFFSDIQLLLSTILQLMMFMSGVFYRVSTLSPKMKQIISLNPMALLIEQFRAILFEHGHPDPYSVALVLCETVIIGSLGFLLINKFNRIYPKLS